MKIYELKESLENVKETNKVQVSVYNEKGQEKFINIDDVIFDNKGNVILDISERISNILIKHEMAIFQRCLDNTPKEKQTQENVEYLCDLFGYQD